MNPGWPRHLLVRHGYAGLVAVLICTLIFPPTIFSPSTALAAFVDATAERLPTTVEPTYNFAVGDLDGDGDPDVVVANGGQNQLLLNDGGGMFTDQTTGRLPTLSEATVAAAPGDVDGDGALDVVLANASGQNRLLHNDGSGTFSDATAARLPADGQVSMSAQFGDLDSDGDLDLVVANRGSQNRILLNDGTGVFTDATATRIAPDRDRSYYVALADVDGDGALDLLVVNHGAQNRLWHNNGLGFFTDITATHLPQIARDSMHATFADVDGDAAPDLLVAEGADGLRLLHNNGDGRFTDVSPTSLPALSDFVIKVLAGDVDADGDVDLVLANAGPDRVLQNDGAGVFHDVTDDLLPADARRSFGVALFDADDDLDLDVLLGTRGERNRLLLNDLDFPRLQVSVAPAYIEVGDTATVSVKTFDEDGLASLTLAVTDPNGGEQTTDLLVHLTDRRATSTFVPIVSGLYTATVMAVDTHGNPNTRSASFMVQEADVNAPQVAVAIETPLPILVGQPVTIRVTATDNRGISNTDLTVNNTPVPLGSEGLATYVATAPGLHTVLAHAVDTSGNTATAAATFAVQADTEAPLVNVSVTPKLIDLAHPVAIDVSVADNVAVTSVSLRVRGPAIPDSLEVSLDATGHAVYTPFQPGIYTLEATAQDPAGNTGINSTTFEAQGVPDSSPPVVGLAVEPPTVAIGDTVTLTVTASDNVGVTETALEINGTPHPLDASGRFTYTPPVVGDYTAMALAGDATGNEGTAVVIFRVVDPTDDTTPPVVGITTPTPDAELTAPTAIVGTVSDETLVGYTLAYSPRGENRFTIFATGATEVLDGVLGTLDTSVLLNDLYDIRLTAEDINGRTTSTTVAYQVTGERKVGQFTITVEDLSIPMAGLPISIRRTYDSRDKGRHDFGVGWSLDIQTIKVRENRVLGTGWLHGRVNTFTYCVQRDGEHYVAVTLPDGRTETFDMVLSPACQTLFPLQETSAEFAARPGTFSRLESLGDNVLLVVGGLTPDVGTFAPVELLQFDATGDLGYYDPARYRLTTPEGMVYNLDQTFGVRTVTDPNGNTLTFGADGILHSAGQSVTFTRDTQGRISAITDPAGNTIQYEYDASGDLVRMTDQEGTVTTYSYNANHGLLLHQHAGNVLLHNVYDDDGRLLSTTNASGRTVTFDHDLDTRQEVVTDADGGISVLEYDAHGHVVRVTDPLGGVTTHTYDADGNQTSTTNALDHTTTRTFDARGNQLTETDPLGQTTSWTYDPAGRVLTKTDPNGHTTTFTYDVAGNLLSQVNALGVTEAAYTYDANGNRLTATDALGRTMTYTYDSSGNPAAVVDHMGNRHEFTYDANGNIVTDTDPQGITITTHNDRRGRFVEKLDGLGKVTRFGYDAFGQLTSATDATGNTVDRILDAHGNEVQSTDVLGHTTTRVFDDKDRLLSQTDPLGRTTIYQYDILDRLIKTIYPDDSFTEVAYDLLGRSIEKVDANGNSWQYAYDAAGRNTTIVDPLGNITSLAYDPAGNLIQETDALGRVTSFTYDAVNRLTQIIFPDGSSEAFTRDLAGRLLSRTDALGRVTQFAYDANDKITRVIDPGGNMTTATYDASGKRLTLTDANGHTTQYAYDSQGRPVSTTYPDGSFETNSYDSLGNLVAVTQPNGETLQYQYDALRRVTAKIYPDGTYVGFIYTPTGQIHTMTDTRGETRYAYDDRDRLISIVYPDGSSLYYTYDAAGNRTSVAAQTSFDAPPQTTTYTYDALHRLHTVTDGEGHTTRYVYDAVGNRSRVEYPNGTTTVYMYDTLNRLTMLEHRQGETVLARYQYILNAVGDRTREEHLDGSAVEYEYDLLRRLVRETHLDVLGTVVSEWAYTYDAVGNRLTKTDVWAGTEAAYTYDANDRLLAAGQVTYTYDANGNTLSRTEAGSTTVYSYDVDNRLVQLSKPDGSVTTYSYDATGTRVQKADAWGQVAYLVDPHNNTGNAQVLVEYDAFSGTHLVSYVYGDDLISQERAGVLSFYHYDGSNHTRLLTDMLGILTDTYTFDAFGLLLSAIGTTVNHYLYSGEQYDPNSGFYYLRARYYVPEQGRFLTKDLLRGRLADPASLHKYLYARNNPIAYADPSGLLTSVQSSMVASASINGIVSAVMGILQHKTFTEIAFEVPISVILGAVTAGVSGVAVSRLMSKFASEVVRANMTYLLIPLIKASIATAGFYLEALTQKAIDLRARMPNIGEITKVFVSNMIFEMSLTIISSEHIIIKAQNDHLGSNIVQKMNADFESDIFSLYGREGEEGLKRIGASIEQFEAVVETVSRKFQKQFASFVPVNSGQLLLDGIQTLGGTLATILTLAIPASGK